MPIRAGMERARIRRRLAWDNALAVGLALSLAAIAWGIGEALPRLTAEIRQRPPSDASAVVCSGAMLRCDECDACSDERATGWRALLAQDPDEGSQPFVVLMCPRCYARELGWSPLLAYVDE